MSRADAHIDNATARAAAAAASAQRLTQAIDDAVRHEQAENLIKSHVLAAAAIGLVPLSLFDIAALVTSQVAMVRTLARHCQVPFDEIRAKTLVISLLAGSAPTLSVIVMSSGAKLIPGIGTLLGSGSVAVTGGAITYALGRVMLHHFEQGGTLLDVDLKHLRAGFTRRLDRGLEVAVGMVIGPRPDTARRRDTNPANPASS